MEDKLKKFGELIDVINKQAETKGAIVTPKFGDNWMSHARTHLGQESILAIAWVQGRRALLLEYALKEQMTTYASKFRREVTDEEIEIRLAMSLFAATPEFEEGFTIGGREMAKWMRQKMNGE